MKIFSSGHLRYDSHHQHSSYKSKRKTYTFSGGVTVPKSTLIDQRSQLLINQRINRLDPSVQLLLCILSSLSISLARPEPVEEEISRDERR